LAEYKCKFKFITFHFIKLQVTKLGVIFVKKKLGVINYHRKLGNIYDIGVNCEFMILPNQILWLENFIKNITMI